MSEQIGIYKITSPSNKIYIGQSVELDKRLIAYQRGKCKAQTKLYNSIKKYGFDKHLFEVIEICEVEKLNERERFYQELFNVIGDGGLNLKLTKTTDKSGRHSDETKDKIRRKAIGRKRNAGVSEQINKTRIKRGLVKGNYHSEEWKEILSEKIKGDKNPAKREDVKKKISEANTGRIKTEEEIKKNIETRRNNGTIFKSPEVRERIRQANIITKNVGRTCCLCCKKSMFVKDIETHLYQAQT